MKLFCFSFAGGTTAFYDPLKRCLAPEITVFPLEYSGHGKRIKAPLYGDFDELIEDLYPVLSNEVAKNGEPYALMGYSMGSISAAEMLQAIIRHRELPLPEHLFLAAHGPGAFEGLRKIDSDDAVKSRTVQFGNIPEQLIQNKSFWRVYLPIFRADYAMIEEYDFADLAIKESIPVTVFYSEQDTPYPVVQGWQKHFAGCCDYISYSGSHFFIEQHYPQIAEEIKKKLLGEKRGA